MEQEGGELFEWGAVHGAFFVFFSGLGEGLLSETQSRHVREMINSELHYWKASIIRCSHHPGEPAQDCRLGSHCCFFHYQKFPHNTVVEKTTPLGVRMQENGCFTRPPINPGSMLLIQFCSLNKTTSDQKVRQWERRWELNLQLCYCPGRCRITYVSGCWNSDIAIENFSNQSSASISII